MTAPATTGTTCTTGTTGTTGATSATSALPATLAHLFRHSLREGRVHPLLHAVQRYRREVPR
jgi:hypothetical protein